MKVSSCGEPIPAEGQEGLLPEDLSPIFIHPKEAKLQHAAALPLPAKITWSITSREHPLYSIILHIHKPPCSCSHAN